MNHSPTSEKFDLAAFTIQEMEQFVLDQGWPLYRTEQILRWMYQRRETQIDRMTDLSHHDRAALNAVATITWPTPARLLQSQDGTIKFHIALADGLAVETVLIPERMRRTLCLSTQVGCTFDCRFCLTGQLGLKRNLKAHEILGQILAVQNSLYDATGDPPRLTHFVFMGMGEPLANIDAVRDALQLMTHERFGFGISPKRITVSTVGITARFQDITELGVNLAVSLNATTESQRNDLMPAANRLVPLPKLLKACRDLPLPPRRHVTFEYVLLGGVNDSPEDARRLTRAIRGIRCKVNLIPWNTIPGSPYAPPEDARIVEFQNILARGRIDAFLRKSKGPDILGACGQLGTCMQAAR